VICVRAAYAEPVRGKSLVGIGVDEYAALEWWWGVNIAEAGLALGSSFKCVTVSNESIGAEKTASFSDIDDFFRVKPPPKKWGSHFEL